MSSRPFDSGSIVAGRYRIVAPLGAGGSARVYLADDIQLGRRVAVKVLHEGLAEDPQFLRRFVAEVQAAAALNNPYIMHVYDSGDAGAPGGPKAPFLVMEFVGGGSLRAVLDSGPLLTPSQALVVGLDAARGLEYAHQRGFVHRDIKPANLLFGEEGRLRIADFGLARAIAEATWTEPQGMLLGTARYTSPEQAMGEPVDGKSDVYALALVLVEAVTGEVPFARDNTHATLVARCDRDLEVPRSLGRLAPVLERAGRVDPALRPDAGELVIAFFAASEDMDRPAEISLPGAISTSVLDAVVDLNALGTEVNDPVGVLAAVERPNDITMIAAPDQTQMVPLPMVATRATVPPSDTSHAGTAGAGDDSFRSDRPGGGDGGEGPDAGSGEQAGPGRPIDIPLDDTEEAAVAPRRRWGRGGGAEPSTAATVATDFAESDDEGYGRRWPWVLAVLAIVGSLIGGGAYWWFAVRIPTHQVFDATGMAAPEAVAQFEKLNFKVRQEFVRVDGSTVGEVVDQQPVSGSELAEGRRVTLRVSRGNTLTTMPTLDASMTEEAARSLIGDAGLAVGAREEAFDEKVPAGNLVSSAAKVDDSGQIPRKSPVDIVISKGPAPRKVPAGLKGKSLTLVKRELTNVQLKYHVTEQFSDSPIGIVLDLNHPANAQLPRDSVVELTVSKGPEPITVPNVIGLTGTAADAALRAAGFTVASVTGSPSNKVTQVLPPVGSKHAEGTSVQLLTSL